MMNRKQLFAEFPMLTVRDHISNIHILIWGIGKVYFILFVSLFVCLLRKAQSLRKYFLMLRCFLCVSKASGMKRWSQVDVSWDLFLITHSSIVFAKIFYYILSRIILAISEDFRNSNISSGMLLGCLKSFANNFLYWCKDLNVKKKKKDVNVYIFHFLFSFH